MSQGPATDFVRALDAPLALLRGRFGDWGPTMATASFSTVIVSLPNLFLASTVQAAATTGDLDAMWPALAGTYGSICCLYPLLFAGAAAQAACMSDVVEGRPVGVVQSYAALGSLGYLGPALLAILASGVAFISCCFGGFLLWMPLGLLLPAAAAGRNGSAALASGVELALLRTGPGLFDRPGWKVVALACVWWMLQTSASGVAQLPVLLSMGSRLWDLVQAGDFEALRSFSGVDPWLGSLSAILGGGAQVLTNGYLYAGLALLYRDARELSEGSALEREIRGGAPEP